MSSHKRNKFLFILFFAFVCPFIVNAQFGTQFTPNRSFEEIARDRDEYLKKLDQERKHQEEVKKHNEWVQNETIRISSGKQIGTITSIAGAVLMCIGVLICIISSNRESGLNNGKLL